MDTHLLPRLVRREVESRLALYPVVALVGPRQCGKTTLARSLGGAYFDLEQPADRLRLDLEWSARLDAPGLLVLDEAQAWPDVFPRIRASVDESTTRPGAATDKPGRGVGRFLLLGSVSPALMRNVSESLAGRLSLIELTPFLLGELVDAEPRRRHWSMGGYPDGGVRDPRRYPRWQRDYLTLLVQRDLPTWGLPARPQTTDRLVRMLAALHGQAWNASEVGKSLGLSYHTVNSYLDYLVEAFLIRRLPSFQANLGKRLVKSPKVYWRDPGLLHAILNVPDEHALLGQPWVGASFEGYVIEQALGTLAAHGRHADAYYFRTSDHKEIDLVLDFGTERWAVEVKLTSSPSPEHMARLDAHADLIGATRRVLVSRTATPAGDARRLSCNLETFLSELVPPVQGSGEA